MNGNDAIDSKKSIFEQLEAISELNKGELGKFVLPIEWFSEYDLIEKAIYELLIELKRSHDDKHGKDLEKKYYKSLERKGKEDNGKIPGFKIKKDETGIKYLEFIAQDDWSKINVFEGGFIQGAKGIKVNEKKFLAKIQDLLNKQSINSELTIEKEYKDGTINSQTYINRKRELFDNIPDAYDYMSKSLGELKKYIEYIEDRDEYKEMIEEDRRKYQMSCVIAEGEKFPSNKNGIRKSTNIQRTNKLIEEEVRINFLKELQVENNAIYRKENKPISINDDEYKGFVYEVKENGKIIILEPTIGDSFTKIKYLSNEEFNRIKSKLEIRRPQSKEAINEISELDVIKETIRQVFSKTIKECSEDRTIKQSSHTTEEIFKANMQFFVTGDMNNYKKQLEKKYDPGFISNKKSIITDDRNRMIKDRGEK